LTAGDIRDLARQCGFELAGVARAEPCEDRDRYHRWVAAGHAGRMGYLADRRAAVRDDPRNLMPSARSIVCVGKLYQTPWPHTLDQPDSGHGWISRYAWGSDYHDEVRCGLESLERRIRERAAVPLESKICVDTAPLLERSYARLAGLGWIGRNTMLINQELGSWFFLGELLLSLDIPPDSPPPDRCGTCTACIDACPTAAIGPLGIDSARCISYFTIELRGPVPEEHRAGIGPHVFGCDLCQDVCPWNRRAPDTAETAFAPRQFAPPLESLAALDETAFRDTFRDSPVTRARYSGFLRNVAIAMGNSGLGKFRRPLETLAENDDPVVAEAAGWALMRLPTVPPAP
jgi:epoxyqueuosine reductase